MAKIVPKLAAFYCTIEEDRSNRNIANCILTVLILAFCQDKIALSRHIGNFTGMIIVIHVTALFPLLINYALAYVEVSLQGQSLPGLTDTVTDGALGLLPWT